MKNSADRGECYPPRPITPSEICRILRILRKPNSIMFLSFIHNNNNFKNKLKQAKTSVDVKFILIAIFIGKVRR